MIGDFIEGFLATLSMVLFVIFVLVALWITINVVIFAFNVGNIFITLIIVSLLCSVIGGVANMILEY
jgi:hypothetical protein